MLHQIEPPDASHECNRLKQRHARCDRIISKEIPAKIIYEDDTSLAFRDINPQVPMRLHVAHEPCMPCRGPLIIAETDVISAFMMLLMMHQPHRHEPWRLDKCRPYTHCDERVRIPMQAPVHFLVIPKHRDGLTQLCKSEPRHEQLLGHLMHVAGKVALQGALSLLPYHATGLPHGQCLDWGVVMGGGGGGLQIFD